MHEFEKVLVNIIAREGFHRYMDGLFTRWTGETSSVIDACFETEGACYHFMSIFVFLLVLEPAVRLLIVYQSIKFKYSPLCCNFRLLLIFLRSLRR